MGAARGHFARLRLRTDSPDAAGFYRSLDFTPFTAGPACSHQIVLAAESGVSTQRKGAGVWNRANSGCLKDKIDSGEMRRETGSAPD